MFTGLIREIGRIRSLTPAGGVLRIDLQAPQSAPDLNLGDSLAVNGICLTVTRKQTDLVRVEAAAETRRISTLPRWRVGQHVHLEPALRAGDSLGGHIVLGHVDGMGTVLTQEKRAGSWFLTVGLEPELARFLLPKGSVTLDGVSLTVDSGPFQDRFTVNVIPHTLHHTRLAELRPGNKVNLEMDVLVKAARGEGLPAADLGPPLASNEAGVRTMSQLLAKGFRRRSR